MRAHTCLLGSRGSARVTGTSLRTVPSSREMPAGIWHLCVVLGNSPSPLSTSCRIHTRQEGRVRV